VVDAMSERGPDDWIDKPLLRRAQSSG
jgi:hypothetical protein